MEIVIDVLVLVHLAAREEGGRTGKKQHIALEYRGLRQQIKPSCDPSTQRFEGQC